MQNFISYKWRVINTFLGDSYKDIEGDAKEVTQFIDDILDGKIKMEITTRSLPKTPVTLTKKNIKKFFK